MHQWRSLHDAWWRLATQHQPRSVSDALACSLLQTGSFVYRIAVDLRNTAYERGWAKSVTLPCRVVSVGNLTVGGTGKTSCVRLIAEKLSARGKRVAVLSRGYGGSRRDYWLRWDHNRLLVNGAEQPFLDGLADEPLLLARALPGVPIVVGPRRDQTGQLACTTFGADTVVLDDGFQHRRVRRDCDIVLVHARMPLGGWAVLPRGPMREPLASLARAHVIMVTKVDEALETLGAVTERLRAVNPEAVLVTAMHEPTDLLDSRSGSREEPQRLNGLRVGLISSIGDPAGFESTIRRLHATIVWHQSFPDHYRYQQADVNGVIAQLNAIRPDAVVTTEKDWIRLQPWTVDRGPWTAPFWVLRVQMKIFSGEPELDARLACL